MPRRLVLHFDINKTLVMKDQAKGEVSVTSFLLKVIAKGAWGRMLMKKVAKDREELTWVLAYDQLSYKQQPFLELQEGEEDLGPLISYWDHIHEKFPLKSPQEIPDEQERAQANAEHQQIIDEKLTNFPSKGHPGSKFASSYSKMIKNLVLPAATREELHIKEEAIGQIEKSAIPVADVTCEEVENLLNFNSNLPDEQRWLKIFTEGKFNLVPSFFKLLNGLKKAKREFAIVFRSFGQELPDIIWEFNKFCSGEHPCFNGNQVPLMKFDGVKGVKDLRIKKKQQIGLWYRSEGSDIKQSQLVTGSLKRRTTENVDDHDLGTLEDFYDKEVSAEILRNHGEAHLKLLEVLKRKPCMAIQDDYEGWNNNGKSNMHGKLLLIDQSDYNTHQIFFDDVDTAVDVRDAITGEQIPESQAENKYLFRVQPQKVILDGDYFTNQLKIAEELRDREIAAVEGQLDENNEPPKGLTPADWQALQKAPNEEYLLKTVLPVLYQGMKVVDQQRPNMPLEYLALYLLKHQDQIKLPPKE